MSVKCIKRKEDVFNNLNPKGKNFVNEIHNKIREKNNIEKNGQELLNNNSDFHINDSGNDNGDITKLKKELYPTNFNQKALGTINNNNNIGIFGFNNYLYLRDLNAFNLCNKITNINNLIEPNILNINNRNIILKAQLNNISQLELLFNKLVEIGLKALSNINNKNNYLLNYSRKNFLDFIYHYKNNNLNNYNYLPNNYNENKQHIQKEKKKEKNEPLNYQKNENAVKEKNPNTKQIKSLINIELILKGEEKRTVVRLHPIPQYYSSFDVSKLIDQYLHIENGKNQRIYKALYVPLSKTIGKNIGFCFIMMVEPKYVIDFYTTFNGITFHKKKSRKPCTVIWADVQGDDFLKISDDPLRSPIIFKDLIDNK